MAKYLVEIDIPDGRYCYDCKFIDGEYGYCHLFEDGKAMNLENTGKEYYYVKEDRCPGKNKV